MWVSDAVRKLYAFHPSTDGEVSAFTCDASQHCCATIYRGSATVGDSPSFIQVNMDCSPCHKFPRQFELLCGCAKNLVGGYISQPDRILRLFCLWRSQRTIFTYGPGALQEGLIPVPGSMLPEPWPCLSAKSDAPDWHQTWRQHA